MTAKLGTVYTLQLDPALPVGVYFRFEGYKQLYKVVKGERGMNCPKCAFWGGDVDKTPTPTVRANIARCCRFSCNGETRKDGFDVYAVKVKAERGKK